MNLRILLIPAMVLTFFSSLNAQQRTCDMQVTLLEPAASTVINAFAAYNIRVNIVNNGPDTLFAGDTLYYNKPTQPLFNYSPYILTQPIHPNDNVTLTLETLNNINSNLHDETMDYYIYVVSNPSNTGAFIDTTHDDNNYDVNTNVTFKAGQPTDIEDVELNNTSLNIYPVPAGSGINLTWDASGIAESVMVTDISGRKVLEDRFNQKKGKAYLDISSLSPGWYIVQLQTDKGIARGKFIKR